MSTAPVTGIGVVPVNPEEFTSNKLLEEYLHWMKKIQTIFLRTPITPGDYKELQEAMQALKKLATEGDSTSRPGKTYFMPKAMLEKLNTIFTLLNSTGISLDKPLDQAGAIAAMEFLKNYKYMVTGPDGKQQEVTFNLLLIGAVGELTGAAKSLQSMLYVEFVLAANGKFEADLAALEKQLLITKKVTALLTEMQNYRNSLITVPNPSVGTDGKPIPPIVNVGLDAVKKMADYCDRLQALMDQLKAQGVDSEETGTLASALAQIKQDIEGCLKHANDKAITDPNFPSRLPGQSYGDWRKTWSAQNEDDYDKWAFGAGGGAGKPIIRDWFLDANQNPGSTSGKFADNLTKAMTANVALNDTQKEELRTIQYAYEQFIKIANTLMQMTTKLIEKSAQAIKQ